MGEGLKNIATGVACLLILGGALKLGDYLTNPAAPKKAPVDSGSHGSRRVPGNLGCQYYAQEGDAIEVATGSDEGRTIVDYITKMKTYCPDGVTIVYPDRRTDFLPP